MQYYFVIIGSVMLLMGCYLTVRRISIVLKGVRTIGKIEAYQVSEYEGWRYLSPVVSFEDGVGKTHRFVNSTGFFLKKPDLGTMVELIYSKESPDSALIASFWHICAAPLALIGLGVAGLAVSL